jgi:hypothetical protein
MEFVIECENDKIVVWRRTFVGFFFYICAICRFDELPNIVLTNDSSPRKFTKLCQSRLTNSGKLPADISSYVSVRDKNHVNIPIFMRLFPPALVENVHVFCACTELRTRIYGTKSIYGSIIPIQYFYLKTDIRIVTNLLVIRLKPLYVCPESWKQSRNAYV